MAEFSEDYIQMKKWADGINPDDEQPGNNTIQKKDNKTGLPDNLKSGTELAAAAIDSNAAQKALDKLVEVSNQEEA